MPKRREQKKIIPEGLGSGRARIWPYILGLSLDAIFHGALLIHYGWSFYHALYLLVSFLFFIYPSYFVVDVIWSLRPSVCSILSGRTLINRAYYMNTMRRDVNSAHYEAVTISIPVYMEDNEVIFETIAGSLRALKRYREISGEEGNLIVSDDGIGPLLGGCCLPDRLEELFNIERQASYLLSPAEKKALERIRFYRQREVGFVIRPAERRRGLFKKASNLNYTLKLGKALAGGARSEELFAEGGTFAGGYAEGTVITNEFILLLDKDSGVPERIMECVLPEFFFEPKLAYIQCATKALNISDNYFSYATAHQVNNLFFNIWPCKALQGFFVPLVGHNVFLRKSILEESGLWPEDRVSEDYAKALDYYKQGYHGKYAQIRGLEFTEYVSRSFFEETVKQHRYSYGLLEMIFDGSLDRRKTRSCDAFYMYLYFFSVVNEVMLLPTVLVEAYFGNVHILWAGFIVCNICFIILPCIRGLMMRSSLPEEETEKMRHTLLIAVSFVGHSYSMLSGAIRFIGNKVRPNTKPFPSSSVDELRYGFKQGLALILDYVSKNRLFLVIALLCLDRGLFMLTRKGIEPITVLTYSYILLGTVLCPIVLTPQLFRGRARRLGTSRRGEGSIHEEGVVLSGRGLGGQKGSELMNMESKGGEEGAVNRSPAFHRELETDIHQFLTSYNSLLQEGIRLEELPLRIAEGYDYESCLKRDELGKKQIYQLRRKADGKRAILRMTVDYDEEDALYEAGLLQNLDHPCLPKVFEAFEEEGRKVIIREYIEGRSLDEIIKSKGVLAASHIFDIVLKLVDVLSYLHSQSPPVIHRDIKPQNIIIDREGDVHLIDFGIARRHKEGRTQDTHVILTHDYAPPEQYGFDQTSTLTDIYSTGIVMLYMATGNLLRSELEAQIVNNRLRNLIHRCIALDPKLRLQSVDEIAAYIHRQGERNKKSIGAYIAASVCLVLLGLSLLSYLFGVKKWETYGLKQGYDSGFGVGYTEGYEAAPVFKLPEGGVASTDNGNSYGNMGMAFPTFAAEGGGRIYYILDGDIYSMTGEGLDVRREVSAEEASALSYYNGWLYYNSSGDIVQTNIYNNRRDVILEDAGGRLYIEGGRYYIVKEDALYLFEPLRLDITKLMDLSPHDYLSIFSGRVYLLPRGSRKLRVVDLPLTDLELGEEAKAMRRFQGLSKDVYKGFCFYDKQLYCSVKEDEMAKLIRIDMEKAEIEFIAELDALAFQVCDRGIYYIDASDGSLKLCTLDGKFRMRVTSNQISSFNIAGDYIFYHNRSDGDSLWSVRTDATDDHRIRPGR